MRAFIWFGVGVIIVLMLVLLFGCAELTQMTDDWCDNHPNAPASRCWDHRSQP